MDEIEFFEGTVYLVGCQHEGRYPQVDSYMAEIHDDYALHLICDECNYEGAQDI